jgi:hypothetical protein
VCLLLFGVVCGLLVIVVGGVGVGVCLVVYVWLCVGVGDVGCCVL